MQCVDPYKNLLHLFVYCFSHSYYLFDTWTMTKRNTTTKIPKTCSTKNNAVEWLFFFFALLKCPMRNNTLENCDAFCFGLPILEYYIFGRTHVYKFEKYFVCYFITLSIEFHLGQGKTMPFQYNNQNYFLIRYRTFKKEFPIEI